MSKTVLMKLLVGGGIAAALTTGGYYLVDGLGREGRGRSRRSAEIEKSQEKESENDVVGEWEAVFWDGFGGVNCQQWKMKLEEGGLSQRPPSTKCETRWGLKQSKKRDEKIVLKLRIRESVFKGIKKTDEEERKKIEKKLDDGLGSNLKEMCKKGYRKNEEKGNGKGWFIYTCEE